MGDSSISRRGFIALGVAGAGALAAPGIISAEGPSDRLRVGFVGIGGRGGTLLGVALTNRYVDVAAVCDIDSGHLKSAADRIEKAYGTRPAEYPDHNKLLSEAKVDAVVSATPCAEHYRIYRDCIEAGKHLYGEKPMCVSVKEADDLVAAQERSPKLKVQVGFQRRSSPRWIEGVKLLREDRVLGDLVEGRCAFNNEWGPPEGLGAKGHWLSRVERSGDWMVEQAVHSWDAQNWVAGAPPLRAYGIGSRPFQRYNPERDVHDFYTAVLEYPNGLTLHFNHSWVSPDDPAFKGSYDRYLGLLGGLDLGEGKIIWSSRSEKKPEERVAWFQKEPADETRLSLYSFFDCIRNDRKPNSTVYNGRDATLTALLVRKAVNERRPVTWEEMLKSC